MTVTEHFKREYGITVMEYAENLRMEHAEYLLLESECSVKEIALFSGFADVEYCPVASKSATECLPARGEKKKYPLSLGKNPEFCQFSHTYCYILHPFAFLLILRKIYATMKKTRRAAVL